MTRPPLSYYVGLVGLLAIGVALVLTWRWVGQAGPASLAARAALRVLLAFVGVLWVIAMLPEFQLVR